MKKLSFVLGFCALSCFHAGAQEKSEKVTETKFKFFSCFVENAKIPVPEATVRVKVSGRYAAFSDGSYRLTSLKGYLDYQDPDQPKLFEVWGNDALVNDDSYKPTKYVGYNRFKVSLFGVETVALLLPEDFEKYKDMDAKLMLSTIDSVGVGTISLNCK